MIGQVEELGLKSETDMVALNCEALCAVTRMVLPYMECNSRIIQDVYKRQGPAFRSREI